MLGEVMLGDSRKAEQGSWAILDHMGRVLPSPGRWAGTGAVWILPEKNDHLAIITGGLSHFGVVAAQMNWHITLQATVKPKILSSLMCQV